MLGLTLKPKMLSHFDIENSEEFKTTKYFCKTNFDMKKIKDEASHYVDLPKIYAFEDEREKELPRASPIREIGHATLLQYLASTLSAKFPVSYSMAMTVLTT